MLAIFSKEFGEGIKLWLEILIAAGTVTAPLWLYLRKLWKKHVIAHILRVRQVLDNQLAQGEQISTLTRDVSEINKQLKPNGGSSMMDKVNRLIDANHYIKENQIAERRLSPDALACTDPKGRCTFVNLAWLKLAGFNSEQEAYGDGWRRSVHPGDIDRVSEEWKRAIDNQSPITIRFRKMNLMTSEVFLVESKTTIIRDIKGEITEYFSIQKVIERIE